MRSRLWLGVVAVLLLSLVASLAGAEEVIQVWRSPVGLYPRDLSASPASGSCWVAYSSPGGDIGPVVQLAADGTPLRQMDVLASALAVNPADGSVWLQEWDAESGKGTLVHLAADGTELLRITPPIAPSSMAVDPADSSCWLVLGYVHSSASGQDWYGGLAHVAADGSVLLKVMDSTPRWSVSANPGDGSVWVAQGVQGQVVHLTREGDELYRGPVSAGSVCVDPANGSCWVGGTGFVAHLASDGSTLWWGDDYGFADAWVPEDPAPPACAVAVNAWDHTCWITDVDQVVHLAADGRELSRTSGFDFSAAGQWFATPGLAANPTDGSCWVADVGHDQVARLAVVGHPVQRFRDIPADFWACTEIGACADVGIVQGYPDGTYRPAVVVTRDQMAVYVARGIMVATGSAATDVPPGPAVPTFRDVDVDHWAYKYIEFCAAQGVVQGYPGGAYRPDESVNRGQMAVYIARSAPHPLDAPDPDDFVPPPGSLFPDVTADGDWAWCFRYVEYIAMLPTGIVEGYPDGKYHPEVPVTRDQMAVYAARGFELLE